ncbi:FAD-dependent oxidoreductase [Desulfonispora thiosulfatigenes]|uniref:FAD-dependent oxidoreductase n=1 Tax=Desulfonispora thiosulfatigenes TaxID=83661 RepID=UPI0013566C0C|nr:FAD-dependent oxidoreductase [Desulfonispora thiosulfatigenes]
MLKKRILLPILATLLILMGCAMANEKNPGPPPPTDNNFDVIVVGGEPEGVAAAVSASRNGATVLLVEDDHALGGLMTLGKLNYIDMCHNSKGELLTRGIFEEFHDAVGGTAFDVTLATKVFHDMVEDQRSIVLKLNTKVSGVMKNGNTVTGIRVSENGTPKTYFAKRIIDATTDADIAAMAGAPYTLAGEDIGEKDRLMGVTLVFELTGVDWDRVTKHIKSGDNPHAGVTKKAAWGYTNEGYAYETKDPMMHLRGFNAARQDNGNVLINALLIFGVDVLSEESKKEGIARANKELEYLMPYINKNYVGFENAKLLETAEQLYVRESRHIIGEYQLTIDDVLENRDQWDRITIGSYPVDIQPNIKQRAGTVVGSPDQYSIPFRSLVPLKVENLLVVGRSASYTSLAAGSARVIPIGMCEGEAAGVASIYSIENEMTFRELSKSKDDIEKVQKQLTKQGAYLKPFEVKTPIMDHWAYEGLKTIRGLGLLDGGYVNDYRLEAQMEKWRFQNLVNRTLEKSKLENPYTVDVSLTPTVSEILSATHYAMTGEQISGNEARKVLKDKGILTEKLEPYFAKNYAIPQAAEVTYLIANVYKYLQK